MWGCVSMYDIGSRLKDIRIKRGLTQKTLAKRINKSVSAISGYESNVQTPPTDVLISISQVLHVPITYFVDLSSEISYSAKGLSDEQRAFLDLFFAEITTPSETGEELSKRQIEIVRRLLILFSSH